MRGRVAMVTRGWCPLYIFFLINLEALKTTASILTGIRGGYDGNRSLGLEVVTMVTGHWD